MFDEFVQEKKSTGGLLKKESNTIYYNVTSKDTKYVVMVSLVKSEQPEELLCVRVAHKVPHDGKYLEKCNSFNCATVSVIASIKDDVLTASSALHNPTRELIDTEVVQLITVLEYLM